MLPTEDRVIIKPIPPETKTKTGLIIPSEAQKIALWEVVDVGPQQGQVKLEPGMVVMIPEGAGYDFEDKGEPRKVIRHGSVDLYDYKK